MCICVCVWVIGRGGQFDQIESPVILRIPIVRVSTPLRISLGGSFYNRDLFAIFLSLCFVSLFYLPCGVVRPRQLICRLYPTLTPVCITKIYLPNYGKDESNYYDYLPGNSL